MAEAKAQQSRGITKNSIEVSSWLKNLPLAPEYRPTIEEFQDPIGFIFKIEKEASKYGICKIIPPVCSASKKTVIFNLNQSILARVRSSDTNPKDNPSPTFTTRQQQVGFSPRKHCPVKKHVWQSGENYTVSDFEAKARFFQKNYLNKWSKKTLTPLEIETLYWKATLDKPISVEYANDMPGSAFVPLSRKKTSKVSGGDGLTVGETAWNMRGVSRSDGSLLKFMKEDIPGVTSPMVYLAMLFSWFAWHVEDHDLHSLNYMHMGAAKTWYGVLREAAPAFEDVIRLQGYGGGINPIVTFATLGEKTTVMSPEVLVNAGVPCCRLVQNAGEFVVTFPGAYHSGFSHGFNCGEASNIATPEWVRLARDAAIRRASINLPPMVSHFQLLYDLAISLSSRVPMTKIPEPRSSRLKDKKKGEGETLVKELFVQDIIQNKELLYTLGKGSPVVLLPRDSTDNCILKTSHIGYLMKDKSDPSIGLCSTDSKMKFFNDVKLDKKQRSKGSISVKGRFPKSSGYIRPPLFGVSSDESRALHNENESTNTEEELRAQCDRLPNKGHFSCVTCGVLCYGCVAIVKPREVTAHYLISAKSNHISDWSTASAVDSKSLTPSRLNAGTELSTSLGWMAKKTRNGLVDVPRGSVERGLTEITEGSRKMNSHVETPRDNSSLGLLALTYADSSDSDEDQIEAPVDAKKTESFNFSATNRLDSNNSESPFHNHCSGLSGCCDISFPLRSCGDEVPLQNFDPYEEHGCVVADFEDRCYQSSDRMVSSAKTPMDDISMSFASRIDEDSSRLHVFCLQHAAEVEQQLGSVGGAQMLLLCHSDYPKLQAKAIVMADELGLDHLGSDITFREATEDDKEKIKSALDSEEAIHGNGDWAVKLGINLYYSANLSRSPLYCQQMPYNSVIYNAFGCGTSDNNSPEQKVHGKWSGKQKKIVVAGKWCGKVWMSNQVHPLLAGRDDGLEQERAFLVLPTPEHPKPSSAKLEKPSKIHAIELAPASSKVGKKRKSKTETKPASRAKSLKVEEPASAPDDAVDNKFVQQYKRNFRNKRKNIMKETPPPIDNCEQETEQSTLHSEDSLEGGPSTRLRKRTLQPPRDHRTKLVETKSVSKKRKSNLKTKKAPEFNASAGNSDQKASDEEAEYACDVEGCTMSFSTRQELMLHKQNICPKENCRKKFFSHKYLLQHRRVHEEHRPLICPWKGCGKTFKWAWARTEHIRVHTGVRPYVCNVNGCGQTFRFVSDFSRHKRKTGHSSKKRKK